MSSISLARITCKLQAGGRLVMYMQTKSSEPPTLKTTPLQTVTAVQHIQLHQTRHYKCCCKVLLGLVLGHPLTLCWLVSCPRCPAAADLQAGYAVRRSPAAQHSTTQAGATMMSLYLLRLTKLGSQQSLQANHT